MLSRVADSLFWLGRYSERVETNAHMITLKLDQMLERSMGDADASDEWRMVVSICGYIDDFNTRYQQVSLEQIAHYLLSDELNYNAIWPLMHVIRENARNARDVIPNDLWVVWNELYLTYQQSSLKEQYELLGTVDFLETVRKTSLIATGIIDSLMTRDESFLFVKIGKWIERSEKTALIVSHLLEHDNDLSREFRANFALQLTNANEEFTRRFRNRDSDDILNFLMGDLKCSRSVAYGMQKIKSTVLDLEGEEAQPYTQKLMAAIKQIEQIVQIDANELSVNERKDWVNNIRQLCTDFGPVFSETYYLTKPILV